MDAAINVFATHEVEGAAAELIEWDFPVEFVFRVRCHHGARRCYGFPLPLAERQSAAGQQLVCRRRKRLQAAYVDAALQISRVVSVQRAETILLEQGLPQRVIARVLYLNGLPSNRNSGQGQA